jgi:hypothetical protein
MIFDVKNLACRVTSFNRGIVLVLIVQGSTVLSQQILFKVVLTGWIILDDFFSKIYLLQMIIFNCGRQYTTSKQHLLPIVFFIDFCLLDTIPSSKLSSHVESLDCSTITKKRPKFKKKK